MRKGVVRVQPCRHVKARHRLPVLPEYLQRLPLGRMRKGALRIQTYLPIKARYRLPVLPEPLQRLSLDPVRRGAPRVQPQRLVGARYRLPVPVEFLQRLSFGLICRGVPWIRFRCPVRHAVAPRRLLGSCGSAPLPRRAGAPLPGCQGGMRARRDLPSPYHGAGRGPAAPSPSNRRHPVHLAPFACSKLQAMDVYPFEGQGLPTPTAGTVAKKRPVRPSLRTAQRYRRPARPRMLAVSSSGRSGFAPVHSAK